jgi:hypothetical protein
MTTATILSWVLAAAPEPSTPTTEVSDLVIARVEMIDTGDVQLVAYDTAGEIIGSVALWTVESRMYIASDFEDGYDEIEIIDGRASRTSTLPDGVAPTRVSAMLDLLAQSDPQEGKISCGLSILGTAIACAGSAALLPAIGCVTGTYEVACHCAEFIGPKPPEEWC